MVASSPIVAVFGSSTVGPGDDGYERAVRCGRLLARAGCTVVTGGYGGVMEAASRGAAEAGGRVIGITAPRLFPHRAGPNRFVEEVIEATSLPERIHLLLDHSKACIVLEPSLGTLAEMVVAWTASSVGRKPQGTVVTVGEQWRSIVESLAAELGAQPADVACVETVDEAVTTVAALIGVERVDDQA